MKTEMYNHVIDRHDHEYSVEIPFEENKVPHHFQNLFPENVSKGYQERGRETAVVPMI